MLEILRKIKNMVMLITNCEGCGREYSEYHFNVCPYCGCDKDYPDIH